MAFSLLLGNGSWVFCQGRLADFVPISGGMGAGTTRVLHQGDCTKKGHFSESYSARPP